MTGDGTEWQTGRKPQLGNMSQPRVNRDVVGTGGMTLLGEQTEQVAGLENQGTDPVVTPASCLDRVAEVETVTGW